LLMGVLFRISFIDDPDHPVCLAPKTRTRAHSRHGHGSLSDFHLPGRHKGRGSKGHEVGPVPVVT
ncbi:hypothetical protein, partial [Escherichia coli]|uniref:hypothetical protein n=1 Tax=Escherichia coli TaxID=562 RepID=UPI001BDB83A1